MTNREASPEGPSEGHGPHGGPLVAVNGGFVEISVFETGGPTSLPSVLLRRAQAVHCGRRPAPPRSKPSDLTAGGSRLPSKSALGSFSPWARSPSRTSSARRPRARRRHGSAPVRGPLHRGRARA